MHKKIKVTLTKDEKRCVRTQKLRITDLSKYDVLELEEVLEVSYERARELCALIQFQIIPSIGIKFAEDLVSMNLFSVEDLKGKDGAKLFEAYEKQQGCWIDSCVEDQFRLAVNYADTGDASKKWWDFTKERKRYRAESGYSDGRPTKAWHERESKYQSK